MATAFNELKRILSARIELARREQKILGRMLHQLPTAAPRRKALTCPRCDRRFAMPMHLGRHLAMSHKRRRAA